MKQRTIKNSISLTGIGLHKGNPVNVVLYPLPEDSGIIFKRSDKNTEIVLSPENVIDTTMATVIGNDSVSISTIEHFLSAIYSYGIDNLLVEVDSEEMPIMDGSATSFCMFLNEAGIQEQAVSKKIMKITKPVQVESDGKFVELKPSKKTVFNFEIDFDHMSIGKQNYSFDFSTGNFKEEISKARTFGFLKDVQYLQSKGLAKGGSLKNAVVLDDDSILNKEGLRYENEFVRHKILDALGDMRVLGYNVLGEYNSFAGGHKLNHLLTKKLLEEKCYEIIELKEKSFSKQFEKLNFALA